MLPTTTANDIIGAALKAAGLASDVGGPAAVQGDTSNATSSWHFHTASSQWFRVDWPSVPTSQQISAADTVIQGTDLSPSGIAAAENLAFRTAAVALLTDPSPIPKALKAAIELLVDEINILRQRDVDRAADVAAATSLADLKTRWAARSALSQRTYAQAKTAVTSHLNAGDAD